MATSLRAAATSVASATSFIPRQSFEVSQSIIRSYFLGHHAGALTSMKKILSNISLIIECRDSRVPLTSTNPLLESSLTGRDRIIVYTKMDLSFPASQNRARARHEALLERFHAEAGSRGLGIVRDANNEYAADSSVWGTSPRVIFAEESRARTIERILSALKERAAAADSLTGMRALVVGMPNAGKSTLLNALRRVGMAGGSATSPAGSHQGKVARTSSGPGTTRKLATPVRVIPEDASAGIEQGVFVVDTPGVFVPYVGDVDAMLKLSLVGCVKDGVVPVETLADYLLFHLNLRNPAWYDMFCAPTNDVVTFLDAIGRRTGKLAKGGEPSREQAAAWVVQQWRQGKLGQFVLDQIDEDTLRMWSEKGTAAAGPGGERISMNQARRRQKEVRKARNLAKRQAAAEGP